MAFVSRGRGNHWWFWDGIYMNCITVTDYWHQFSEFRLRGVWHAWQVGFHVCVRMLSLNLQLNEAVQVSR